MEEETVVTKVESHSNSNSPESTQKSGLHTKNQFQQNGFNSEIFEQNGHKTPYEQNNHSYEQTSYSHEQKNLSYEENGHPYAQNGHFYEQHGYSQKQKSETMSQTTNTDDPAVAVPQVASSTMTVSLRKKRSLEDKICRICGDKALAHNFDVITCESCKAFFRRNALRREELRECAFQRSCPINIRTRRFCSACRLKKCFAIGMRADMILDEKKRRARMDKLSQKRVVSHPPIHRQHPSGSSGSSDSGSNTDSQPGSEDGFSINDSPSACNNSSSGAVNGNTMVNNGKLNVDVQHHVDYCNGFEKNTRSPKSRGNSPPQGGSPYSLMPAAGEHIHIHHGGEGGGGETQYQNNTGAFPNCRRFEPVPVSQLPSDPHMYWRLTEDERALLTQITATYQDTILRLPRQGGASERTERAVNSITLEDLLGRCDVCANNVVKLMKGLADYRTLQVEDQLAALKACAMRTLILKGAACFVVERDAWIKAYGELPVSLFVRVTGHEKLIRQHAAFCRSLKTLLKNDVTMYALLQCVMLFDPQQPNIADRQLVNTLRDKYLLLLKHYLESQMSYIYAEQYLDHLKERLGELTVLGQKMTHMFKEWTGLIQPLMIEVLSLA